MLQRIILFRSSKESSPVEPDVIKFISGNPFVEVTKGIIHLFKGIVDLIFWGKSFTNNFER